MPVCFLRRDRKGMDQDGRGDEEELGGAETEENIIRIYCRGKFIFNKRKTNLLKFIVYVYFQHIYICYIQNYMFLMPHTKRLTLILVIFRLQKQTRGFLLT